MVGRSWTVKIIVKIGSFLSLAKYSRKKSTPCLKMNAVAALVSNTGYKYRFKPCGLSPCFLPCSR